MKKLTKAQLRQRALLAKLPAIFTLYEDFQGTCSPRTVIMVADVEVGRFHTGDARVFDSLQRAGAIIYQTGSYKNDICRRDYKKAGA